MSFEILEIVVCPCCGCKHLDVTILCVHETAYVAAIFEINSVFHANEKLLGYFFIVRILQFMVDSEIKKITFLLMRFPKKNFHLKAST